ncbi:hypothetical protein ASPWEDRAFT_146417 [Aspergillus wentii DTO 134E9]|uniref:Carboxypeptidase n=1 Tax=Aspergillus wentii DTO 134E9 TaxID=1073089 RepID=A0A1L9S1U4_ASPWE|nr:uncharacterized protein ASPWEDRAFT_146417 [Aspergillus wentii DTO 134E9]KAI9930883.1 hypothetical protein MW887_010534 [Aspergillus wentii]OJJ41129.1 hypothetical protein ASPWEDRAFT_146417 [Aspergillus wentii DTO 134E9]
MMNIAGILSFFHAALAIPMIARSLLTSPSDISQFEVHSLPDGPSLGPSWAGRLPVPNTEEGNSMFFWLFETEDLDYDDHLIIWLNGGPGCSSLIGLTTGNGPVSFDGNSTRLIQNPNSWTKLGHVLYVDQPVGTGLSTASAPNPVTNNDRVVSDFYSWLQNFFSNFPHLQKKQVHLMGESYAGIYIPYFASAIVDNQDSSPINLRSMSMGDGTWGNAAASSFVTTGAYLKSQSSLLQIPDDIISAFAKADEICGFDSVMEHANTFPPKGKITIPGDPEGMNYKRHRRSQGSILSDTCNTHPTTEDGVLSSILNSTCQGPCATFSTAMDYLNTVSASGVGKECFDVYDIKNDCNTIDPFHLLASYFSRADVQTTLNALPPDSDSGDATLFSACSDDILQTLVSVAVPPTPPAYSILPSLVTSHNLALHIYSGDHDMLINHLGTELCLQNMTWRGAQGFSQKPSRVFFTDNATPANLAMQNNGDGLAEAGIWASERGVSFHLFRDAGHSVFIDKPREMFAYVRDVVVRG